MSQEFKIGDPSSRQYLYTGPDIASGKGVVIFAWSVARKPPAWCSARMNQTLGCARPTSSTGKPRIRHWD
jgi:hypothetical protein